MVLATSTGGATRSTSFSVIVVVSLILVVLVGSGCLIVATANDEEDESTCENDLDSTVGTSNPIVHPDDAKLLLYHFESTSSTQDEARLVAEQYVKQNNDDDIHAFCVTATEQTSGRGTSGRQWMGARGNTFVTIGIRQATWMEDLKGIPLTLLPLKIGSLVANRVQELLDECKASDDTGVAPLVTVKWPNDVLVNEKKISGVLIESSSNGWFLIGIGVNLAYAPVVPTSGPNHGRTSTCVQDYCSSPDWSKLVEDKARRMGVNLASDLNQWIQKTSAAGSPNEASLSVLNDWKKWVDWDMELVMRDTPNQERVRMIDLLPDGRIQVVGQDDGALRTLVSDYFL